MQTIGEREPLHGELGRFYDAIENPRKSRGELPILRDAELRSYLADVRERTLEVLDEVDIGAGAEDPLLREGFVYEMLIAHEQQHNETMLQLLQMVDGYELPASWLRTSARRVRVFASTWQRKLGHACSGWSADRESASTRSALRRPASPTTTSGRATGRAGRLRDRSNPRHQRRLHRLHGGDGRRAAALLGARRRAAAGSSTAMGRRDPVDLDPARHPRLLARGRRLRPLGRQAAAERAGVGGRPPGPGRCRPGLGMDVLGLPRLPRLRAVPLPRVLRRSSSATPTRCCGAAPGRPTAI